MTSEVEALKTNEFLRRRKLRIQQVREQSKDIAKTIRQRAKVAQLRSLEDLDTKKAKEYLEHQEKLVKRLEELYVRGVRNLGSAHKNAEQVNQLDKNIKKKPDLSKSRGIEAAAEIRCKKQEKLDQQKKLLDRKLEAREAANEISREKSSSVANKLLAKSSSSKTTLEPETNDAATITDPITEQPKNTDEIVVVPTNMETPLEWNSALPKEWDTEIPELALPKDINSGRSPKPSARDARWHKPNLFALSEEMPLSLRGGISRVLTEGLSSGTINNKPSVTLVSEYIQNRDLRLRQPDIVNCKKSSEDLQNIKQTILQSRASKTEGMSKSSARCSACHVASSQVIPVPSWEVEIECTNCHQHYSEHKSIPTSRHSKSVTNSQINEIFSSIRPRIQDDVRPSPVLRGSSPFRRSKVPPNLISAKQINADKGKSSAIDAVLPGRSSVKMYNHSTRTEHEVPFSDKNIVTRDTVSDEDAYTLAIKETLSQEAVKDQKLQKKVQNMRNKVAMTKQAVDKEYKDTMAFLKNMPKNSKPNKTSYLDDRRQKAQSERKQRLMQYEFKKIQKESRLPSSPLNKKRRSISKSPCKWLDDEQTARDCQYSWMPVPDSDDSLVVHTIPTNVKDGKGNSVKFANVDSYHEYRSRHKHTPPTKDTAGNKTNDNATESSIASDTESVENLNVKENKDVSDPEQIIIYKIVDKKSDLSNSKSGKSKLLKKFARSLSSSDREQLAKQLRSEDSIADSHQRDISASRVDTRVSIDQLTDGVYKKVSENGDNIRALHVEDSPRHDDRTDSNVRTECSCQVQSKSNFGVEWECHDTRAAAKSSKKCKHSNKSKQCPVKHSSEISGLSFKNVNEKSCNNEIKLVDDAGNEAGKFYIGATGFLKDDDYEVIIQLRKKDALKNDKKANAEVKESISSKLEEQPSETIRITPIPQTSVEKHESLSSSDAPISTVSTQEIGIGKETSSEIKSKDQAINTSQSIGTNDSNNNKHTIDEPKKVVEEKGVGTEGGENTDIPRPATSASTQTTMGSPIHRPPYNHMSSSTSTAYMSPPEIILPQYLRRDKNLRDQSINYVYVTKDGDYDNCTHIQMEEEKCCEDKIGCTCKRCRHATKLIVKQIKTLRHIHESQESIKAPPNTARSDAYRPRRRKSKCSTISGPSPVKSRPSNQNGIVCNKKKTCNNPIKCKKLNTSTKHSNQSLKRVTPPRRVQNKTNIKTNLNPVVKTYVDKLLTLNRASIKAVDVMNQECSSVATPGSSIVEVPQNIPLDDNNIKTAVDLVPRISLEQFKDALIAHLVKKSSVNVCANSDDMSRKRSSVHFPRKKSVHKVKSFNVSKHFTKSKASPSQDTKHTSLTTSSSTSKEEYMKRKPVYFQKGRSKSTPSPRNSVNNDLTCKSQSSEGVNKRQNNNKQNIIQIDTKILPDYTKSDTHVTKSAERKKSHKRSTPDLPPPNIDYLYGSKTPTQTVKMQEINEDINLIRMAEGKLQNMEKIADLTEKCTLRLSNLAKVLDEVRKSKSSHRYDSDSEPDNHQKKVDLSSPINLVEEQQTPENINNEQNKQDLQSENQIVDEANTLPNPSKIVPRSLSDRGTSYSLEYVSFLQDIPKPNRSRSPVQKGDVPNLRSPSSANDIAHLKGRTKPPPALSTGLRRSLKHVQDDVVPHELSTVVEVDSPLSVKNKNQPINHNVHPAASSARIGRDIPDLGTSLDKNNPDLLQTNKGQDKGSILSNNPKIQMMDLKQFNDIMLKPFMSIKEYAKQCNIENLYEGSKMDTSPRPIEAINDELSSLHSESSLPDVIAELLKRNIINEPFKFDTAASNVNSTTVSSESSLSMLALSKMRSDDKKKSKVMFENKAETSDTMSISSNPDLENAFKQLGMGWASSTLKKTKERLALSSSSNTSSSSSSHFKNKGGHGDIPVLETDTVSSVLGLSKQKEAEQQTSHSKSMTVKQFLAKELANKITFTNNSRREDTEDEFVSLIETKLPDSIKLGDLEGIEKSVDSGRSTINPRARTSTPVQIYRSMTYHSSSGSNASNGLFSNADDLSSVKGTSNSIRNHSTSDKDDLTIPNYSLRTKKPSNCSKSD